MIKNTRATDNRLKSLLLEELGQGLVEFALVLPILLLLTLGTVLLTLSYIQKARMNGLAYMSARVASVRSPTSMRRLLLCGAAKSIF